MVHFLNKKTLNVLGAGCLLASILAGMVPSPIGKLNVLVRVLLFKYSGLHGACFDSKRARLETSKPEILLLLLKLETTTLVKLLHPKSY